MSLISPTTAARHLVAGCLLALAGCAAQPPTPTRTPTVDSAAPPPAADSPHRTGAKPDSPAKAQAPLSVAPVPAPPPDPASNIFFASSSDQINPAGKRLLRNVAEKVKRKPRADITLIGHTDDAGSTEFNIALAQRRVDAVASELESLGVSPRQISCISYGDEAPGSISCAQETCRQQKRRVEVRLSGDN